LNPANRDFALEEFACSHNPPPPFPKQQ